LNLVIGVTLVNVVPGQEKAAYNELVRIKGIKDVYHVFGEYDFVIISNVEGLSALNKLVDTIRDSENVTSTQTIVGAEL
jgi:DNA-binding Lrp family transcriptional regulator